LHDPTFLEAAQTLAARIARETRGDDEQRLARGFVLVLSRPIKPEESQRLLAYLQQQRAIFGSEPASAHELLPEDTNDAGAEWVALASVLLNLDEFITRE
jgi:hypothetical protein